MAETIDPPAGGPQFAELPDAPETRGAAVAPIPRKTLAPAVGAVRPGGGALDGGTGRLRADPRVRLGRRVPPADGATHKAGKTPYLDFFFPQAPLNAYWNAGWMRLFGEPGDGARGGRQMGAAGVLLAAHAVYRRFPIAAGGWPAR